MGHRSNFLDNPQPGSFAPLFELLLVNSLASGETCHFPTTDISEHFLCHFETAIIAVRPIAIIQDGWCFWPCLFRFHVQYWGYESAKFRVAPIAPSK